MKNYPRKNSKSFPKTFEKKPAKFAGKPVTSPNADLKEHSLTQPMNFPKNWLIVLDEVIPAFVKERFSPKDTWKNKPFTQDDVSFFSKGLLELSEFFTIDREGTKLPNYFTTARFRSSYFLYFFALQGAKFLALFDRYPDAVDAAIEHAKKTGKLEIIDVGSGPGTASIAFLLSVLARYENAEVKNGKKQLPFAVHLRWIDYNETILRDGELFLARILERFSEFEGDIQLTTEARSWWKHPKNFRAEASIVLFGNVLNESPNDPRVFQEGLTPFFKNPQGGGVLIVEPAFKAASQRVSQIRDELVRQADTAGVEGVSPGFVVMANTPHVLWGPCLHSEKCPLAEGRDWCHFSVPTKLPGTFFKKFSVKLGGVRDWLKFSFVWLASKHPELQPPQHLQNHHRRVVSDAMRTPRGMENQLCEPVRVGWVKTPNYPLHRGDFIRYPLKNDSVLQSKDPGARNGKSIRNRVPRSRIQK